MTSSANLTPDYTVNLINTARNPSAIEITPVWLDSGGNLYDSEGFHVVPLENGTYIDDKGIHVYPLEKSNPLFIRHPATLYEFESELGQGTYAKVYSAIQKTTGLRVAIKIVQITCLEFSTLLHEIEISRYAHSPFLTKFFDCYSIGSQLWIIMEYCALGTVEDVIKNTQPFSEDQTAAAIKMILHSLLSLHQAHIIHRDIKGSNVLVDEKGFFKLADYGLASILSSTLGSSDSLCGTPYYVSPEICLQNVIGYSFKTDIWSLGILTYLMLTGSVPPKLRPLLPNELLKYIPLSHSSDFELPGKPSPNYPWLHSSEMELSNQFGVDRKLPLGLNWSSDVKDFLRCCLQKDPANRWDAAQLLQHRFIFRAPRFVQPCRPSSLGVEKNPVDIFSLPIIPDEIQLETIQPPTHGAWPCTSSYTAISRNIKPYLKTDDYGLGCSVQFALNLVPGTLQPPKMLESQLKRTIIVQAMAVRHVSFFIPGQPIEYIPSISHNQRTADLYIMLQHQPKNVSCDSNDSQSFVCLGKIDSERISTGMIVDKDESKKPQRYLSDVHECPNKQPKFNGDTKTPHQAYNLNPQSTQSGNVQDIHQASNPSPSNPSSNNPSP